MTVCSANSAHLRYRRDFPFTCLCCHVRHAALSVVMGGCSSPCSKSSLLYFAKWWFFDTDQGEFCAPVLGRLCIPLPRAFILHCNESVYENFCILMLCSRNTSRYTRHPSLLLDFHKGRCKELSPGGREMTMTMRRISGMSIFRLIPILCVPQV